MSGKAMGLAELEEIASVYSKQALRMDWYVHPGLEVICLASGALTYEIVGYGTVHLKSGDALVIPPRTRHRLLGGIDAPSRRVSFKLVRNCKAFAHLRRKLMAKVATPFRLSARAAATRNRLGDILHSAERLSSERKAEARILTELLVFDCAVDSPPPAPRPSEKLMDDAISWLDNNYSRHISVDMLVARIGYGRTHFFNLFKKWTGLSPNDYLVRLRIQKAGRLLATSKLPVKDIAKSVGFRDAGFFARAFKRYTGITPTSARGSATPFPRTHPQSPHLAR